MTMKIDDGTGSQRQAEVTTLNRLATDAMAMHPAAVANRRGDAYCAVFEADPNGTDIDFFYLKNEDTEKDLIIYKIRMSTGTADVDVDIKLGVTGSPTSGTVVTPSNMRTDSGAANVTAEYRDADLALTGGTVVDTLYIDKDFIGEQEFDYPAGIILPPGKAMVLNCVGTDPTADINTEMFFYFE
jgi:hypothetical protein